MASIRYEIDNSVPLMKHLDVEILRLLIRVDVNGIFVSQICSFVIFV